MVPDNVEESGLVKVISYIWGYRKKSFLRYSLFPQLYLLISLSLCVVKIMTSGFEGFLSFGMSFVIPVIFGYGIISILYVILYVDVLKIEKENRMSNLKKALGANPGR